MTPQETATAAAKEVCGFLSLGNVTEATSIILKHYAPLEQELEQYKAVAKELAESESCTYCRNKGYVPDGMGGQTKCLCGMNPKSKYHALTKFNNL